MRTRGLTRTSNAELGGIDGLYGYDKYENIREHTPGQQILATLHLKDDSLASVGIPFRSFDSVAVLPYIPLTSSNRLIWMTTKKSFRRSAAVVATCLAASLLAASVPAYSGEVAAQEPPTTMMTRLQDLSNRASELAVNALSMLGIRYKYGGTSPENGLDCSGLVRYVFKETWGADLPRTS